MYRKVRSKLGSIKSGVQKNQNHKNKLRKDLNNDFLINREVRFHLGNVHLPNVMISHHSQLLSLDAKSVECCTIKVHFANDNPKPDNAPYLDAMV